MLRAGNLELTTCVNGQILVEAGTIAKYVAFSIGIAQDLGYGIFGIFLLAAFVSLQLLVHDQLSMGQNVALVMNLMMYRTYL